MGRVWQTYQGLSITPKMHSGAPVATASKTGPSTWDLKKSLACQNVFVRSPLEFDEPYPDNIRSTKRLAIRFSCRSISGWSRVKCKRPITQLTDRHRHSEVVVSSASWSRNTLLRMTRESCAGQSSEPSIQRWVVRKTLHRNRGPIVGQARSNASVEFDRIKTPRRFLYHIQNYCKNGTFVLWFFGSCWCDDAGDSSLGFWFVERASVERVADAPT